MCVIVVGIEIKRFDGRIGLAALCGGIDQAARALHSA